MEEDARKDREERFAGWCRELEALPDDFELKLKDGFKADLELQPFRWMGLGIDLLKSGKSATTIISRQRRQLKPAMSLRGCRGAKLPTGPGLGEDSKESGRRGVWGERGASAPPPPTSEVTGYF